MYMKLSLFLSHTPEAVEKYSQPGTAEAVGIFEPDLFHPTPFPTALLCAYYHLFLKCSGKKFSQML